MYARILVATDGSATATAGVREALRLAAELRSELRIVHVLPQPVLLLGASAVPATLDLEGVARDAGAQLLHEARALADGANVRVETRLLEHAGAHVGERIVDEARVWGADLIVLGTHGRRGLRRVVIGSDAEEVVAGSHVPVLLIRA